MKQQTVTATPATNYYPNLKEVIDRLDEIAKSDFRIWLMTSQGIGCGATKAAEILRGIVRGPITEQQRIASYFGRSEKTLFKQS